VSYKHGDIVKVPFPFVDRRAVKHRPALVISSLSFGDKSGHSIMAMITSAAHSNWPLDVSITDVDHAGLPTACIVRMKLFTLDHRLILERMGQLAPVDQRAVNAKLKRLLPTD
jgi:mRNA interferase MazF